MVSVHDVVRELRRRLPDAGDVKIHKLAYYCQGWQVAWTGRPMFRETIEAWTNGPVVADLWHDEKRGRERPPAQRLTDENVAVVDYVVGRYGGSTGRELVRRTHLEDPWRDVGEDEAVFVTANLEITQDALCAWFSKDEEFLTHRDAVTTLRQRRDIYGFDGPPIPDDLHEAVLRVLAQQGSEAAAG